MILRCASVHQFIVLPLLTSLALLPCPAAPPEPLPVLPVPVDTPLVRIALTRAATATTLVLSAEPGARLVAQDGSIVATGTGPWTLRRTDKQMRVTNTRGKVLALGGEGEVWRVQGEEADVIMQVAVSNTKAQTYRGAVEIRLVAGKWSVINEIALESYLCSVVASEMDSRAPREALKAQAVACRTFALYRLLRRRAPDDFDLRDDSQEQVYNGAGAERPACDRAVQETEGQILALDGAPAAALYGADCGGITAPGANANDFPPSVTDMDAHGPPENPRPPVWTLHYTPDALNTLLRKNAALRAMGTLESIEVLERDSSERVRKLRFVWRTAGENNELVVSPLPVRAADESGRERESFRVRLARWRGVRGEGPPRTAHKAQSEEAREITGDSFRSLLGVSILKSTKFTVQREDNGDFVITGRGSGHGRGMCQTGTMMLAAPPFSQEYATILNRYYPGAVLSRIRYADPEAP